MLQSYLCVVLSEPDIKLTKKSITKLSISKSLLQNKITIILVLLFNETLYQ